MIEGDDDNGDISDEETEPQLSTVGPEDLDVVYENTQDHLYGLKNKELVKVLNKNTPRRIIRPTIVDSFVRTIQSSELIELETCTRLENLFFNFKSLSNTISRAVPLGSDTSNCQWCGPGFRRAC
jgi:hypothetical protein